MVLGPGRCGLVLGARCFWGAISGRVTCWVDDERSSRHVFDHTRAGQVCTAAALEALAQRLMRDIGLDAKGRPLETMSSAYNAVHITRPSVSMTSERLLSATRAHVHSITSKIKRGCTPNSFNTDDTQDVVPFTSIFLFSQALHRTPYSSKPLHLHLPLIPIYCPFFSACAAFALSFCNSEIVPLSAFNSPRSALRTLSLSLASACFHSALPSFCSFSCACFSRSISCLRDSEAAREEDVSNGRGVKEGRVRSVYIRRFPCRPERCAWW